jgi:glutaredoxin
MYQRRVVLYARRRSLRCWRAKRILARGGYHFEVVEASEDSPWGLRKRLTHGGAYRQAVPYLFVDDRPVGGLAEIRTWVARAPSNTWYATSFRLGAWRCC